MDQSDYCYSVDGGVSKIPCSSSAFFKPVVTVSSRVQYTGGSGKYSDPYIIDLSSYTAS
jgi:hypothetical protein